MSVKLHRQAEELMGEAEILAGTGRSDEARARWLEAARLEQEVFVQIPEDRQKTRGIIAVSAVALYRRAGALDDAIRTATEYLTDGNLPKAWQTELQALLDDVRAERQTATNGRARESEQHDVSFRSTNAGE